MKSETAKMLFGFGLGALVGTAVGYLLTEDNRKKVGKGIQDAFDKVKEQAAEAKAYAVGKAEKLAGKAGEKVNDWKKEMDDLRRDMEAIQSGKTPKN